MLKSWLLFLISICLPVFALNEVQLLSEKDLDAASVIAIGEFKPATDIKKVMGQFRYAAQLRETLLLGLRSAGFTTTDGVDSTRPPDLILEGAFTELDNKGAVTSVGITLSVKSYATKKDILLISNTQSSFGGDFKDQIRSLTDEQGLAIVKYFKERKNAKGAAASQQSSPSFTCKELTSSKMVFCALYAPQIRATANIISVEIQKWTGKRKVPMSKIPYSVDTAFQRIYSQRSSDAPMESLPEPIRSLLKSESIDYCLLLYDFKDRVPGGMKEKTGAPVSVLVPAPGTPGMMMIPGGGGDRLGAANQFTSIYCRLSIFNIDANKSLVSDVLWADKEDCGDEVVQCLVGMIKKSLSEYDEKKKKKVPCWK